MTSTTTTLDRLDSILKPWIWLFVPGILLHEATHYLVAWPVAESVSVDPDGEIPTVRMLWAPGTALWVIIAAHLAPTLLGWAIGAAGVVAVLGGVLPAFPVWVWGYLVLNWVAFAYPGGEDRDVPGAVLA